LLRRGIGFVRRKCACQHHGEGHHGPHICEQLGFSVGDYLTAVVLRELSKKPMHGYELYEKISQLKYYPFKHDQSVIYSLLRKLNNHGLVRYSLQEGNGGLRKVYEITEEGLKYLEQLVEYISKLKQAFDLFLNA